jgi:hypothetical protein
MHTTLRIYTGMPGVAPRFVANRPALEAVLRGIAGFAGYRLIATPDGIATVTICETKEGCEESVRAAAAWVKANMPDLAPKPPQVITGESLISFGGNKPPK